MIDLETIQSAISDLLARAISYLPNLVTALVIVLSGWALGRLLAALARRLARRVGLDGLIQRSGLTRALEQAQITRPASELIASLLFWLLFLSFLLVALETLGLSVATGPLQGLIAYVPRLLAAILALVAGALLAQFLGRAVQVATANMGIEYHQALGQLVRGVLLVITLIVAVEQLGFDVSVLTHTFTNLLTIAAAGVALAFGLAGRDVARNILAGYYARESLSLGEQLTIDGEMGTLEAIGTLSAEIAVDGGRLVIPNTRLTEAKVKIRDRGSSPQSEAE